MPRARKLQKQGILLIRIRASILLSCPSRKAGSYGAYFC
jgi:hypothetical protein